MAGYGEPCVIVPAGDMSDNIVSAIFRGRGVDEAVGFYASWTSVDTPTGVLTLEGSPDGTTFTTEVIPANALHGATNATWSSGAVSIVGGGAVEIRLTHLPRVYRWRYTHGATGTGDALLITRR